jgi:hypothetical protein
MAQLTYLDIVNKVLKKLREETVTSVDYNVYSALIGEFVNDAKREVEDAWLWSMQRQFVSFTSDGNYAYDVSTGTAVSTTNGIVTNARSTLCFDSYNRPVAFDKTSGQEMQLIFVDHELMTVWDNLDTFNSSNTVPAHFSLSGTTGDGWTIFFDGFPTSRQYAFGFYIPQEDLEEDIDVLTIPSAPVVHLATLYALDERGEEIGEPGSKAWLRYEKSLVDAISLDAHKDSDKAMFKVY